MFRRAVEMDVSDPNKWWRELKTTSFYGSSPARKHFIIQEEKGGHYELNPGVFRTQIQIKTGGVLSLLT